MSVRARRALLYALATAAGVVMAFPFVWMLLTSVKSESEATAFPPGLLPTQWLFSNYADAWRAAPFGRYFLNSAIMALGTIALSLATAALAAYALARMRVPGRGLIFGVLLATLVIPPEVTLIPNYIAMQRLGWYNTYLALIVPFGASVFNVFLLRQAFLQLPQELYDAAVLEGCGHLRYLWRFAVPLSRPTLTIFRSDVSTNFQLLMAGSVMALAPIVVLFLLTQRQLVQGIARSGLRG